MRKLACYLVIVGCIFGSFFGVSNAQEIEESISDDTVVLESAPEELTVVNTEVVVARIELVQEVPQKLEGKLEDTEGYKIVGIQKMQARILEGTYKDVVHSFESTITSNPNNIQPKQGDKVLVRIQELSDGTFELIINDIYYFDTVILLVGILFFVFLLFLGKSAFRIGISIAILSGSFLWLLNAIILDKFSFVSFSLLLIIAMAVLSFLVYGVNKETLTIYISSLLGMISMYFSSVFFINFFSDNKFKTLFNVHVHTQVMDSVLLLKVVILLVGLLFVMIVSKFMVVSARKIQTTTVGLNFFEFLIKVLNDSRLKLLQYCLVLFTMILGLFIPTFTDIRLSQETIITNFFNQEIILELLIVYASIVVSIFITSIVAAILSGRVLYGAHDLPKQKKLL